MESPQTKFEGKIKNDNRDSNDMEFELKTLLKENRRYFPHSFIYNLFKSQNVINDLYRFHKFCSDPQRLSALIKGCKRVQINFKLSDFYNSLSKEDMINKKIKVFELSELNSIENIIFISRIYILNRFIYKLIPIDKRKLPNLVGIDRKTCDTLFEIIAKPLLLSLEKDKIVSNYNTNLHKFYGIFAKLLKDENSIYRPNPAYVAKMVSLAKKDPNVLRQCYILNSCTTRRLNDLTKSVLLTYGKFQINAGIRVKSNGTLWCKQKFTECNILNHNQVSYKIFFNSENNVYDLFVTVANTFK